MEGRLVLQRFQFPERIYNHGSVILPVCDLCWQPGFLRANPVLKDMDDCLSSEQDRVLIADWTICSSWSLSALSHFKDLGISRSLLPLFHSLKIMSISCIWSPSLFIDKIVFPDARLQLSMRWLNRPDMHAFFLWKTGSGFCRFNISWDGDKIPTAWFKHINDGCARCLPTPSSSLSLELLCDEFLYY